jgi:DNA-binding MarR family transcriptional regulator
MSNEKKARPPDSDLIQACRQLYGAIEDFDQMVAEIAGISKSDLRALNRLENGPMQAGEIAISLGLTTGAITTLIDRLESKGLVIRTRDPNDRRVVLIEPTPKLYTQIGSIYRKMAVALDERSTMMSRQELAQCVKSLQLVSEVYREIIRSLDSQE